jgi:hypothetical protein
MEKELSFEFFFENKKMRIVMHEGARVKEGKI